LVQGLIERLLRDLFRKIRCWRVPANWSRTDWFDEIHAVATEAAWRAAGEFDPLRGIAFEKFASLRVLHGALARSRQEWNFSSHFLPILPEAGLDLERIQCEGSGLEPPPAPEQGPAGVSINEALDRLPEQLRSVVVQLFWYGISEAEVAANLRLSQSAVSQRKQLAMAALRRFLSS
jgi:RNA polymerase sigma factor (sigma-70 family)